jgi:hypothetical protein
MYRTFQPLTDPGGAKGHQLILPWKIKITLAALPSAQAVSDSAKTSGLATKGIIIFIANPLVYLIFAYQNIKYLSGLATKWIISFVANPLILVSSITARPLHTVAY